MPKVESTVFAGDPTRVGTTFVQRIKEGGRINEYSGEVTGYAKARWYAVQLKSKTFTIAVEYRFEPTETNGTKMIFNCEILNPTFIIKVFMFIFSGFTKSGMCKLPPVSRSALWENTAKRGDGIPSNARIFLAITLSPVTKSSPGPPPV